MMTQKIFVVAIASLNSLLGFCNSSSANGIQWNYYLCDDGDNVWAEIGKLSEQSAAIPITTSGDIEIPSMLGGYVVRGIGNYAFKDCFGLTSITIPNGVERIGKYAFKDCFGLTSITIPNGVMSIGNYAFQNCSGLITVEIPNSVTFIDRNTFDGCYSLRSVTIPQRVCNRGISNVFSTYETISEIVISSGATSIDDNAFRYCCGLTSVVVPNGITSIGDSAFDGCVGIQSICIPDSVTQIGYSPFHDCSGLKTIYISSSSSLSKSELTYGLSGVAVVCYKKTQRVTFDTNGADVSIPDGVVEYNEKYGVLPSLSRMGYSFQGWTLDGIQISNDTIVTALDDHALVAQWLPNKYLVVFDANGGSGGGSFELAYESSIVAPNVSRDGYAFTGWSPKEVATVPLGGMTYTAQWEINKYSVMFEANGGEGGASVLVEHGKNIEPPVVTRKNYDFIGWFTEAEGGNPIDMVDVSVTSSLKVYAHWQLKPNEWIYNIVDEKAVIIGYTTPVGSIEIPAFIDGCPVVAIADSAFYNCTNLTSVTIGHNVSTIGTYAFSMCNSLDSISISENVAKIESHAFDGCCSLMSIMIPNSVMSIGDSVFYGCSKLQSITVDEDNAIYSSINGLLLSKDGQTLIFGVNGDVEIPRCVTNIAAFAFAGCNGLTRVTVASSVTSIGASAFADCCGLKNIEIPKSVVSISSGAFSGCKALEEITIPFVGSLRGNSGSPEALFGHIFGAAYYAGGTFTRQYYSASRYSDFYIPTTLRRVTITDEPSIGYGAFSYWTRLMDVILGAGVVNIGPAAFKGCSGLRKVTVPNSVESVGNQAFDGCSNLTGVYIDDVAAWCRIRFGNYYSNPLVWANKFYVNDSAVIDLVIPDTVTSIGNFAFCKCTWLSSVSLPPSITQIGDYSFRSCSGLTCVTVPDTVTSIGTYAFYGCNNLKNITFEGNSPKVGSSAFANVALGCCAHVQNKSNGWGVEIPGTWQGVSIGYVPFNVLLDAKDGDCAVTVVSVEVGDSIGELPTPTRCGYTFKGWFMSPDSGEEVTSEAIPAGDLTLYAHWERHVVAAPVIIPSDGAVFYGDSCEVVITCATDGAVIYYSDEGPTPRVDDSYLYDAPFTISDTAVIKAVAVFDGVKSDYVTVTITKKVLSLGEVLDVSNAVVVAADLTVPWRSVIDESAKAGGSSARSGAIGNRTNTWLSASVEGAGTMTFWCKVSCEHDEDNTFTWDRLMVYTNDVEIVEWRMDGEMDWTQRSLSFDEGVNTVKWVYYKDRTGADGEDCAWVDAVVWTPAGAAVPIPAVADDADVATVNAVVDDIGFADAAAVKAAIGGSAEEYNAFKNWAGGVKGATGDTLAGEAAVVANAHAAAAYLLGAERLFENEPTVEIGELAIADGESVGTTAMTVAVTVKDGESAVAVNAAKVAAMFEATGDLGDWNGAAKLTPTVTTSGTDSSGKMTFVVTPGDGTASKAFLRIKR